MIISDLSHFEEVVSEAPTIVGGASYTTSCSSLLSSAFLKKLPAAFRNQLKKTKCRVNTLTVKSKGGYASATTAISSKGKTSIGVSFSSSSSSS